MRVQVTVRVEPHTADWMMSLAAQSRAQTGVRLSVNQVAAALLERAEIEGWSITPATRAAAAPPEAQL